MLLSHEILPHFHFSIYWVRRELVLMMILDPQLLLERTQRDYLSGMARQRLLLLL